MNHNLLKFLLAVSTCLYSAYSGAMSWKMSITNSSSGPIAVQIQSDGDDGDASGVHPVSIKNNSLKNTDTARVCSIKTGQLERSSTKHGFKVYGELSPNDFALISLTTTSGVFAKRETKGKIHIATENACCTFDYQQDSLYKDGNLGTFKLSAASSPSVCQSMFTSSTNAAYDSQSQTELNFTVDLIKRAGYTTAPNFQLNSKGREECSGFYNCLIMRDSDYDANWVKQTLQHQNDISKSQPLTNTMYLGTHNTVVSGKYRTGSFAINMFYLDPNNFLTITDQLDLGLRQIELDFLPKGNDLILCHDHVHASSSTSFKDKIMRLLSKGQILCDGNHSLQSALNEVNDWHEKHPDELLFLYVDADQKITDVKGFEALLESSLGAETILRRDGKNPTNSGCDPVFNSDELPKNNDELPASSITAKNLLCNGVNTILYSHYDNDFFKDAKYIFLHADDKRTGNKRPTLHYDKSISVLEETNNFDESKTFANDPHHKSLWTIRGDRTAIARAQNEHDGVPIYEDYITPTNMAKAMQGHVNIFSFDGLSKQDPRLTTAIWSWAKGYPKQDGVTAASLVKGNKNMSIPYRYKNDGTKETADFVLCADSSRQNWTVVDTEIDLADSSPQCIIKQAAATCADIGDFVSPANPREMKLAGLASDEVSADAVLVNYFNEGSRWVANQQCASDIDCNSCD